MRARRVLARPVLAAPVLAGEADEMAGDGGTGWMTLELVGSTYQSFRAGLPPIVPAGREGPGYGEDKSRLAGPGGSSTTTSATTHATLSGPPA